MGQTLTGLDPETGELLWEFPAPASNYANCTSPVVGPIDSIYFNLREGVRGLQLSFANDRFEVGETRASRIAIAQTANMVLHEGTIFGSKEGGVFAAIDASTGETKWQSREPGNCRLIAAKDHLMALGENGQLSFWKVLPDQIELVWQKQVLSGRCWVGPVVAGGLLIVRDSGHLVAYEGP